MNVLGLNNNAPRRCHRALQKKNVLYFHKRRTHQKNKLSCTECVIWVNYVVEYIFIAFTMAEIRYLCNRFSQGVALWIETNHNFYYCR